MLKDDLSIQMVQGKELNKQLKLRKNPYVFESIKKPLLDEYQKNEWNVIKKYKTVCRMRKKKQFDVAFEDRFLTLLAKMGFDSLNKDREIKIAHSKKANVLYKKIDVCALDNETIVLVECKASKQKKKSSFQLEINEIRGIREWVYDTLKNSFGDKKIAWIFATDNILVIKPDQTRMNEAKIIHFS